MIEFSESKLGHVSISIGKCDFRGLSLAFTKLMGTLLREHYFEALKHVVHHSHDVIGEGHCTRSYEPRMNGLRLLKSLIRKGWRR